MTGTAPSFTLRLAGSSDLDRIMAVMAHGFDPDWSEAWTRTQARTLFLVPGQAVWLAERDDVPIGFAAARTVAGESELLLLAVLPQCRQQGVGQALVNTWLDWAQAMGADTCFLEVRDNNPARVFYGGLRFEECGRRPKYYHHRDGTVCDALTMRYQ